MISDPVYLAIKALREELARLDHVIAAVEAMKEGKQLRGRPPKFISDQRIGKTSKNGAKPRTKAVRP